MSSSEVQLGEQLSLFQSVCTTTKKRKTKNDVESSEKTTCLKVYKGSAEVIENSDPHFIKVKTLNGAQLEAGFIVESSTI